MHPPTTAVTAPVQTSTTPHSLLLFLQLFLLLLLLLMLMMTMLMLILMMLMLMLMLLMLLLLLLLSLLLSSFCEIRAPSRPLLPPVPACSQSKHIATVRPAPTL